MEKLSEKIGTIFPYDWSNSQIPEDTFISQVFNKGIKNDIEKTLEYFGPERMDSVLARKKVPVDDFVLKLFEELKVAHSRDKSPLPR